MRARLSRVRGLISCGFGVCFFSLEVPVAQRVTAHKTDSLGGRYGTRWNAST